MKTNTKILKSAYELFAEKGFNGTSIRMIAEHSGVNKALIHYHFKNKDALLEELLDRYYERMNRIFKKALTKEGTLRDRMHELVDGYMDFIEKNLNYSRIMQRESAGGKHMNRIRQRLEPMFQLGVGLIQEEYQNTDSGELAAHHLLISFYGMIISYFTYSGLTGQLTDTDPLSKDSLEDRKRHLHRVMNIVLDEVDKT